MKNRKVMILLVVLVLAVTYYLIFVRVNRRNALVILGNRSWGTMDGGFLIAWAKAVKEKAPSFEHEGKLYDGITGKAVK